MVPLARSLCSLPGLQLGSPLPYQARAEGNPWLALMAALALLERTLARSLKLSPTHFPQLWGFLQLLAERHTYVTTTVEPHINQQ